MSRAKRPAAPKKSAAATSKDTDDLAVLMPNHPFKIRGEQLEMRPFSFGEQLRNNTWLAALIDSLRPAVELLQKGEDGASEILHTFENFADDILPLATLCCGKKLSWCETLDSDSGEAFLWAFWCANRDFFHRRLLQYPAMGRNLAAALLGGVASSQPSSGTGTEQAT